MPRSCCRCGDIKESPNLTEVPLKNMMTQDYKALPEAEHGIQGVLPAHIGAAETTKTVSRLPGTAKTEGATEADPLLAPVLPETNLIVSDTGELRRDRKAKVATIDSPRTKAVYGFLGAAGEIKLNGLTVRCKSPFAVIALSSLTNESIGDSDNILLTAVGRADNTAATYNDDHTIQYDKGNGPIEAEVIVAEIEIDTTLANFRVDAINTHGMQVGPTPADEKDGKLKFTIGGDFPSIYYLIQKI